MRLMVGCSEISGSHSYILDTPVTIFFGASILSPQLINIVQVVAHGGTGARGWGMAAVAASGRAGAQGWHMVAVAA